MKINVESYLIILVVTVGEQLFFTFNFNNDMNNIFSNNISKLITSLIRSFN